MSMVDWENIGTFERYDKFKLNLKEEAKITFEDDGNEVSKEQLKNADFPKDSFVFVVTHDSAKKEFWVNKNNFSLLDSLKECRNDKGVLKGQTVLIKRISDKPNESNYEVSLV